MLVYPTLSRQRCQKSKSGLLPADVTVLLVFSRISKMMNFSALAISRT